MEVNKQFTCLGCRDSTVSLKERNLGQHIDSKYKNAFEDGRV